MKLPARHVRLFALAALAACSPDAPPPAETPPPTPAPSTTPPVADESVAAVRTIDLGDALSVEILREGTGRAARAGSELLVQYEGRTEDSDTPFATTRGLWQPARWVLDPHDPARPVEGLARALVGMKQGTQARVHVPGHFAYGIEGAPSAGIDAHADLIFSFELVEVR